MQKQYFCNFILSLLVLKYSIIIPTFKRPDELEECLESLAKQHFTDFEVIISDGTPEKSLSYVCDPFKDKMNINFLYVEFIGVSEARNLGAEHAKGDYLIFLDSDCIIPEDYLRHVNDYLSTHDVQLFGGPDAAHTSFTDLQKAISYSMTSFLTTGGIRGKKKHIGVYHPRGFNMGIKKTAFEAVRGYSDLVCGEDIDLSIRLIQSGCKSALIEKAVVYHKRRTSFGKFYKQVRRFGAARINLWNRHPAELKWVHLFPAFFTLGLYAIPLLLILLPKMGFALYAVYSFYFLLVFIFSWRETKSVKTAFLSCIAVLIQMTGYGNGFLQNFFEVVVKGNKKGIKL